MVQPTRYSYCGESPCDKIELYQECMHISIIGEKYEYINGMKIVLPQIGVSYKYDLKAELYKFTPSYDKSRYR